MSAQLWSQKFTRYDDDWILVFVAPKNYTFYVLVARGKGKRKNELKLSKKCLQLGFERHERLGVLQSRRKVVPEHWSSSLEGVCTITSLADIVMIQIDSQG